MAQKSKLSSFFWFFKFGNTVPKEKAKLILAGSSDDKLFFVNNGMMLRTLYELRDALVNMSDETFSYHANQEKNDFSAWVKDVHQDHKLAEYLLKAKNRYAALAILDKRLTYLEKLTK